MRFLMSQIFSLFQDTEKKNNPNIKLVNRVSVENKHNREL